MIGQASWIDDWIRANVARRAKVQTRLGGLCRNRRGGEEERSKIEFHFKRFGF